MLFVGRNALELFLNSILTPLQHLHLKHQPAFLEDFFQELVRLGKVDAKGSIRIAFDQIEMHISK